MTEALPTAAWTVIRVTWAKPEYEHFPHEFMLDASGTWVEPGGQFWQEPTVLTRRITGFVVLADGRLAEALREAHEKWIQTGQVAVQRARRETAEAVLDQMRAFANANGTWAGYAAAESKIADDFGLKW